MIHGPARHGNQDTHAHYCCFHIYTESPCVQIAPGDTRCDTQMNQVFGAAKPSVPALSNRLATTRFCIVNILIEK